MRITERDRELLTFAAEHRLVLADHVQKLLGVSGATAYARLRALTVAGMLSQRTVFHHRPGCYQITRTGLGLVGSQLPRPGLNLNCYDHDVGVAWLWLAARAGTFGPLREVLSERWLRSHDASPDGRAQPYAVRLGGLGANGQPRLHYPDLLLIDSGGRRIALELELTPKGRTRREKILAGYGADPSIDVVVYLTDQNGIARSVQASAARLGISDRVHVQHIDQPASTRAASASAAAQRARPTEKRPRAKPERTPAKPAPARRTRTPPSPERGAVL